MFKMNYYYFFKKLIRKKFLLQKKKYIGILRNTWATFFQKIVIFKAKTKSRRSKILNSTNFLKLTALLDTQSRVTLLTSKFHLEDACKDLKGGGDKLSRSWRYFSGNRSETF